MSHRNPPAIHRRLILRLVLAAAALGLPGLVLAQAYPSRPIRLIVPAPPGGSSDVMARTLAKVMGEQNNVAVVVDNRGGASGSIGVQGTISAPPDGYTIMLTLADATIIFPLLKKNPPYRVDRDLTAIAQIAHTNVVFAVNANSPYRTVKDIVDASRQKKLAYGSNGYGTTSHLWIELFKVKTGVDLLHVPYKGAAPSLQALVAGEHDMVVASPASLKAQYDAGRVRPIAATSARRMPGFPSVPTMAESGYPDFVVGAWFGIFGPPNMPPAIADKLHEMVVTAMKSPEYQKHADTFMFDTQPIARAEFVRLVAADSAVWKSAIEAAQIKPED